MIDEFTLWRELIAASAAPDKRDSLAPLDLSIEALSAVGVARVRPDGDLYVPDDFGAVTAAIIPVTPDGDDLVDLVALDVNRPDRWRRRAGMADILGETNARGLCGLPLLVHPGPAGWLRAGGEGVVLLEPSNSALALLRIAADIAGLVTEDPRFAVELEQLLAVPAYRPRIFLPRGRAVAA